MRPGALFGVLWGAWALSWFAAARWASAPVQRPERARVRLTHGLLAVGIFCTLPQASAWLRAGRVWDVGRGGAYALAVLTIPGFLLTWWARVHLGRLWSGAVTLKESHRVIDTGPYGWVRHPIYTGLLEAALASAVATGTIISSAGFALAALGLWLKARVEERLLRGALAPGAYAAYCRRVPMLLPRWRRAEGR
ncbi:MAG TPA: isoprenylcysteine carboxylmethyltransferase family protein [Acetobacteraceae bacterium]|nr:isoprenylcysteine carboxylmethyltransferase family protein [Acetobacteraceae bacterium]